MSKGTLIKWHDDKGYGFVRPENGQPNIFVHISSFPNADRRPQEGDIIHFSIERDERGRQFATNSNIGGLKSAFNEKRLYKPPHDSHGAASFSRINRNGLITQNSISKSNWVLMFVFIILIITALVLSARGRKVKAFPDLLAASPKIAPVIDNQFQCSGKTRCTQMTSCDEAIFYLKNCPGSLTDDDNYDIPCEDQWCGH